MARDQNVTFLSAAPESLSTTTTVARFSIVN